MNEVELKAAIFDIIAATEQKQAEINELHKVRMKLLTELEELQIPCRPVD